MNIEIPNHEIELAKANEVISGIKYEVLLVKPIL
jgi:hypothetical protein